MSVGENGLEDWAVRNEVLKFMPRAFVEMYESLLWAGLGPGMGVRLDAGSGSARDIGVVERLTPTRNERDAQSVRSGGMDQGGGGTDGTLAGLDGEYESERDGESVGMDDDESSERSEVRGSSDGIAEWQCSCGAWEGERSSFCGHCDRIRQRGCAKRLRPDVSVRVGSVVSVGAPKRVRVSTSETVTRGSAKGSAHGKREGARRKDVVGEEYAIAIRARFDRALVRVTREIAKDVESAAGYGKASAALGDAGSDVKAQVDQWRECAREGRLLEARWLYCPYCGSPAVERDVQP